MKIAHLLVSSTCVVATATLATPIVTLATTDGPEAVIATFEGRELNLAESWDEANACAEINGDVNCYRSEAEMDAAHPELAGPAPRVAAPSNTISNRPPTDSDDIYVIAASCSSSLRLYRSTSYAGSVLLLTTRSVTHNLSAYGFDNDTSSYKVGACASTFWSGSNSTGSVYPGATDAYDIAPTMGGGWDNAVSSVRID